MKKAQKMDEKEMQENEETQAEETKSSENLEEQNQLISAEKERDEWKDKFVRLYSEYENFRKRTAKEKVDLSRTATERLMTDLLSILDDFDRAIENNSNVELTL